MKLPSGGYAEVFAEGDTVRKIARAQWLPGEATKPIWSATGVSFATGSIGSYRPSPNEVIEAERRVLESHRAFVRVRDHGETDGRKWLVLDRKDGSLRDRPRSDLSGLLAVMLDLERAGLRHGDLKPDNVLEGFVLCDPTSGIGGANEALLATPAYNPLFEASDVPALGLMLAEAEIATPLASMRTTHLLGPSAKTWWHGMHRAGRGVLADALLSFPRPRAVGCSSDLAWEALGLAWVDGHVEKVDPLPTIAALVARIG